MTENTCSQCRFWRNNGEGEWGSCCRHPPSELAREIRSLTVVVASAVRISAKHLNIKLHGEDSEADDSLWLSGDDLGFFPEAKQDGWCGEYEAKPK